MDRLDEQENDGRAAEEGTEQEMMPVRVHRPQERLAMSPVSAHRPGPSTILCHSGVESGGEYRGTSLRSQRSLSYAGPKSITKPDEGFHSTTPPKTCLFLLARTIH